MARELIEILIENYMILIYLNVLKFIYGPEYDLP